MKFRPCIDLHQGVVKQIVGATLSGDDENRLETNFRAEKPAAWFARQYRQDGLDGGHVIQLGPGNAAAARAALAAWPGGMQIGGGIHIDNAADWLDAGADKVIVTSWVFHDGTVDADRLRRLADRIGKKRLVLDLSCRRQADDYRIVTNRWQTFTRETVSPAILERLSGFCDEFLVHAVDVEGRCRGIEKPLVRLLGQWGQQPITYAGWYPFHGGHPGHRTAGARCHRFYRGQRTGSVRGPRSQIQGSGRAIRSAGRWRRSVRAPVPGLVSRYFVWAPRGCSRSCYPYKPAKSPGFFPRRPSPLRASRLQEAAHGGRGRIQTRR